MTEKRKHPGATGVPPWVDWKLTDRQRLGLRQWLKTWDLQQIDEPALLDKIESAVRTYVQMKELAKRSSPGSVRQNLKRAVSASQKLVAVIHRLDGNSDQLLRGLTRGAHIRDSVTETNRTLEKALALAIANYPLHGRRPEHEREMLAAYLAKALEAHTSAKATTTRGKIFEELLRETFSLLGETYADLHTLAEHVLERQLVTGYGEAVTEFTPYELAPKRRQ